MKFKKMNYIVISIFIAFLLSVSWAMVGFTQTKTEIDDLSFKGTANKETYVLGEPVSVKFEICNKGEVPVKVEGGGPGGGVATGFLKVFIRGKDGEYKQYFGYGWGLIMGRMLDLAPGESRVYEAAKILWNGKLEVSHLNERAAKEALKGRITTEYVFPEPGVYFIKGVSSAGAPATPIESEPVRIVVNEPDGIDLEVWNQIKGNGEIALLLQEGTFNRHFNTEDDAKKEQLSNQVEQIFTQFPNSIYSSYLKQNLEKYKAHQIVIKESMQRALTKPKN